MARKQQTSEVTTNVPTSFNCTIVSVRSPSGNYRRTSFASLDAALETAAAISTGLVKTPNKANQHFADTRIQDTDGRSRSTHWCDGMTSAQAVEALVKAPQSRAEAVEASARNIGAVPVGTVTRSRMVKRLDEGTDIDAERYVTERTIEGVWKRRVKRSVSRPVLKVGINGGASCMVDNANFARSAAAVLGLVKAAEDAGHAIEVVWFTSAKPTPSSNVEIYEICLKRVDQVLDWDVMLGACVGASFFRTVGFDLKNLSPVAHEGSYGYTTRPADEYLAEFAVCAPSNFDNDADAAQWAAQASERLGEGA